MKIWQSANPGSVHWVVININVVKSTGNIHILKIFSQLSSALPVKGDLKSPIEENISLEMI